MSQNQGTPGSSAGAASPDQPGTHAAIQQDADWAPHGTAGELAGRHDDFGALEQRFPDPGLPQHVHRVTDTDPRAAKRAERQVATLFLISLLGSLLFVVAYFAIPLDNIEEDLALQNMLLGLGLGLALFCIGAGAVHWAKKLMPDDEVVEERHVVESSPEDQAAAAEVLREGGEAAGFPRRKLIWGSLTGAMGALLLPAIVPLRDLWVRGDADSPVEQLSRTVWDEGVRLVTDPTGHPIRPEEIPIGSVVHVLPDGLAGNAVEIAEQTEEEVDVLNERAKAAVLLIRLEPEDLVPQPERESWAFGGIVAFSKICTHMGCPVALYEQTTHLLLCPCHQSTFDVEQYCKVVFGPAARALPQLPISVDDEGYLVAQSDFQEPVGPSFWERG